MKTPLCDICELHDSRKRIRIKLDGWVNEKKLYLCKDCYYKIIKKLNVKEKE